MRDIRARELVPGNILAGSGFEINRVVLTHELFARQSRPVVMVRGTYPTGSTKVYKWHPNAALRVLDENDLKADDE